MNQEKEHTLEKERTNLILFIWRNRKPLGYMMLATLIISTVIAFMITPEYRSRAIVFPSASNGVYFSEGRTQKASALDFGEEEQAEQLVQVLSSAALRDRIVKEFDLAKHYNIDPTDPNKTYKLIQAFEGNFTFDRTKFGSIQIDVTDENPKLAAKMANKVVDLIDTVKHEILLTRAVPAFRIMQRKLNQMKRELDSITTILDSFSVQGVVNIEARGGLYEAYGNATNAADRALLRQQIEANKKYSARYDFLQNSRNAKIGQIEYFRNNYEQAESDANTAFSHKFVVERATVSDKKDKPKRLVIILVAVIGSAVFGIFGLLVWQRYQELKQIA